MKQHCAINISWHNMARAKTKNQYHVKCHDEASHNNIQNKARIYMISVVFLMLKQMNKVVYDQQNQRSVTSSQNWYLTPSVSSAIRHMLLYVRSNDNDPAITNSAKQISARKIKSDPHKPNIVISIHPQSHTRKFPSKS